MKQSRIQRPFIGQGILAVLCIWAALGNQASGQYLGAEAVLKRIAEGTNASVAIKPSPQETFRAKLKTFQQQSTALTPEDSAAQWLALAQSFGKLPAGPYESGVLPLTSQDLIAALPGPSVWGAIEKQAEALPMDLNNQGQILSLRLLAHTLTGNPTQRQADITQIRTLAEQEKMHLGQMRYILGNLDEALLQSAASAEEIIALLERKLTQGDNLEETGNPNLRIPDLVPLVGEIKAEALLRKALVRPFLINIDAQTATFKLAQKLALAMIAELKVPQWQLTMSLDAHELYLAMRKQFPKTTREMPYENGGTPYYFTFLIANHRWAEARDEEKQCVKEAYFSLPSEALEHWAIEGKAAEFTQYFHDRLREDPELPFWDDYQRLAAYGGKTAEVTTLLKQAAAQSNLKTATQVMLLNLLCQSQLASDDLTGAVATVRQLLQYGDLPQTRRMTADIKDKKTLAIELARLGVIAGNTNWIETGLAAAGKAATQNEPYNFNLTHQVRLLLELGRGPEAEALLAESLAAQAAKLGYYSHNVSPALSLLLQVYYRAGRYEDVVMLADNSPNWGVADAANLGEALEKNTPLAAYLAGALAKTGRTQEAIGLVNAMLLKHPGSDRLYELLIQLSPQEAAARLDQLFALDPFEERPLIWQAYRLRKSGQLEAAERLARQAIAIDPTDGEEGPGDRLRAYAELWEIVKLKGNTSEADPLEKVLQAVHDAERADELTALGLSKRAIEAYQKSTSVFDDAYCIHARLAVALAKLGQMEAAEQHYRRAYELMPDSFGRLESYCFGCELAFSGERAQAIAERVFTELAAKNPEKAQVQYLLGYLREEQQRYAEALPCYWKAVELDPNYFRVWRQLEGIRQKIIMVPKDRDTITLNLLRLDPLRRHAQPSCETTGNLVALWQAIEQANAKRPTTPASLYPLRASKAALDAQAKSPIHAHRFLEYYEAERQTPASFVMQHPYIAAALRLLDNERSGM